MGARVSRDLRDREAAATLSRSRSDVQANGTIKWKSFDEANNGPANHKQCIVFAKEPWTVENGLLTPTLKLKRNAIEEHYAPFVKEWYDTGRAVVRMTNDE